MWIDRRRGDIIISRNPDAWWRLLCGTEPLTTSCSLIDDCCSHVDRIWVQTWTWNIISYLPQMMYSLLILCPYERTPQLYCVACVTGFTVICTTINGSYTYIKLACLILCQVLNNWNVSYKYKVPQVKCTSNKKTV